MKYSNMKKITASPLKQLGATPQEHAQKSKEQTDAGLDIVGQGAKILAWEDMQLDIAAIEPESMKLRKLEDNVLRDAEREKYADGTAINLGGAYTSVLLHQAIV